MKTTLCKVVLTYVGLFALTMNAFAHEPITFLDENNEEQVVTDYTEITGEETVLSRGWYVVRGDVTSKVEKIEIRGNVHVILADDSYWHAEKQLRFDGYDEYGYMYISTQSHGEKEGRMSLACENESCFLLWGLSIYGGRIVINGSSEPYYAGMFAPNIVLKNCVVNIKSNMGIQCDNITCDGAELTVTTKYVGLMAQNTIEIKSTHRTTKLNVPNIAYGGNQNVTLPDGIVMVVGDKTYTGEVPVDAFHKNSGNKVSGDTSEALSIKGLCTQVTEDLGGWYTLNGICLPEKPTEKGVYIHNNKKFVMK
ncbi:MAG: hypothetical protein J5663_00095 [Bacteroidaceae bacterium]|nr:hypothetical protein [Bacteroidaceae bacterium]